MDTSSLLPYLIFLALLVLTIAMTWAFTEIHRLQIKNRSLLAHAEASRRAIGVFINKLGEQKEIYDALNIIAPQICEDIDAESVGIFVPDINAPHGRLSLHGASCTSAFPILTASASHTPRVFHDPRERTAFFRRETIDENDRTFLGEAYRLRQRILLNLDEVKLARQPLPANVRTLMILPLICAERFAGLIVAVNRGHHKRDFTEEDLDQFAELSALVGMTASLVTIYGERAKQDRIRSEIAFSVELQKALLPAIPKHVGPIAFAAINKSCHEVSGDFYDFVSLDNGRVLTLVADATGKGLPACMMTSMCRSFVRSLAERYTTLKQFMLDLNRLVFENSDDSHYLTANVIVIDPKNRTCDIACAGHPPILFAHHDGTLETVKPEGSALGMWPNDLTDFDTKLLPLEPGASLCIFTDGITEALDEDGNEYGLQRLETLWKSIAHHKPEPNEAINSILLDTHDFADGEPQSDDQTIMVITAN